MRLLVQFANPNTLWPGRLGFPSAVVQRATPLVRWALLILATQFASPFDRVRTLAAGYSGTLRGAPAMPGDAIEPDEPPAWAGEQHRQQLVKDRGLPGRCRGAHRFCVAMGRLFVKDNKRSIDKTNKMFA